MEQDTQQDWYALQAEALRLIRVGNTDVKLGWSTIQLITRPSFESWSSYDLMGLCVTAQPDIYTLVRTRWRMDLDVLKLETPLTMLAERFRRRGPPQPTLEAERCPFVAERAKAIQQRLRSITVPVTIQAPNFGADGISYEVHVESGLSSMSLSWWCNPPKGWEPLATAFHEILAEFERELAAP